MQLKYEKNKVIIRDIEDFIPKHVFECGQCFRWNLEKDGSYTGVAHGKVINLKIENNILEIDNSNKEDFENIWFDYFDLGRNYAEIKRKINVDEKISKAIKFGSGIRILNQDEWEAMISFIISANNRILMIKRAIENLSVKYGKYIGEYRNKDYYSFPTPEELIKGNIEEIRNCKVGFRDKYIFNASKIVSENSGWLYNLKKLEYEAASKELKKIDGIGEKVAHCILLFSMGKYDAFPVDVWVKRIMNLLYTEENNNNKIKEFAKEKFGDYSGFAQQYLFYYARENNIK
jgi:N-glycosylase/DNA lyase